jgi:hypothetical protein
VRTLAALSAVALAAAALGQERPRFDGSVGWSGGSFRFDSDLGGFDDRADAELFQARLEVTSARGFGGGVRFESFSSDSAAGLFRDPLQPLDPGVEARNTAVQAHFTYMLRQHRFQMPLRAGLMQNTLVLDDPIAAAPETEYRSLGPFFEVEPEVTLTRDGASAWTAYGRFGFGYGPTTVEVDNDSRDYETNSSFLYLELGARYRTGPVVLGAAFLGRYQSMDPSAVVGGQFAYGFDGGFHGVLLSVGVSF